MKVIVFGATGMVGQGVLRECLLAPDVTRVLAVGRSATGQRHPKLVEQKHTDLSDYSSIETALAGFDACFFCLGVSSVGMQEADYARLTFDGTLAAAQTLARLNPAMSFVYVSGAGTDSSEKGKTMWARVKGRTENALLRLPFKAVYLFRPGVIQPLYGVRSKTRLYSLIYTVFSPVLSGLRRLFPEAIVSTESIGQAMLAMARRDGPSAVMEAKDIAAAARQKPATA